MSEVNSKQRICDILGVKVGERFTIDGAKTFEGDKAIIYRIEPDGRFSTEPSVPPLGALMHFVDAINKPEMVKRMNDEKTINLTDIEKKILNMMQSLGAEWISRDSAGWAIDIIFFWVARPTNYKGHHPTASIYADGIKHFASIAANAMPSIDRGTCVRIDTLISPTIPH